MERRAALKRISTGGVVVVGASAITSSPAFALDSPVVTAPPDFSLQNGTIADINLIRTIRIVIDSFGAATCTGSSDQAGGGAEIVPFGNGAIGQVAQTANVAVGTVFFAFAGVSNIGDIPTFRKQDPAEWQVGDEVTLTLTVNWRCTYGAVQRDVAPPPPTTKTYRVTAIVLEPVDVTWTEV